jgi:hypothetical protein
MSKQVVDQTRLKKVICWRMWCNMKLYMTFLNLAHQKDYSYTMKDPKYTYIFNADYIM